MNVIALIALAFVIGFAYFVGYVTGVADTERVVHRDYTRKVPREDQR